MTLRGELTAAPECPELLLRPFQRGGNCGSSCEGISLPSASGPWNRVDDPSVGWGPSIKGVPPPKGHDSAPLAPRFPRSGQSGPGHPLHPGCHGGEDARRRHSQDPLSPCDGPEASLPLSASAVGASLQPHKRGRKPRGPAPGETEAAPGPGAGRGEGTLQLRPIPELEPGGLALNAGRNVSGWFH